MIAAPPMAARRSGLGSTLEGVLAQGQGAPPIMPPREAAGIPVQSPIYGAPKPAGPQRPDYAAMLTQALGSQKEPSTLQKIAGVVGPALLAASGNEGMAQQFIASQNAQRAEQDRARRDIAMKTVEWGRLDDQEQAKRNAPQYFSGNEDRVRFDPTTGQSSRVYDAPQDFEDYASSQGLTPGTQPYFDAVEDYVLRGNGPTAFDYDKQLEAVRNAGRLSQEAQRQRNRLTLRGMPSYRDTHAPPPRPAAAKARPTATGANGEKLEYDGAAWVPVR